MSSQSPQPPDDAAIERRRRDGQYAVILAAIVVSAVAVLAVSVLFPAVGDSGFFTYDSVVADPEYHWTFLTLVGVMIVGSTVAVGLAGLLLVPRRGWQWATAGFSLAMVGAALYAIGVGGWAMVYSFAADSPALDPSAAAAFVESVNADGYRLFAAAFTGAIVVTIGTILMAVGLWRSGNLPKWIIALRVFGAILPLLVGVEGVVGALVESPQAIASVLTGWYAWRLRHVLRG